MADRTGRIIGVAASSAAIDKDKDEDEGKKKDSDPLQTCTPDIMMICDKLLETVEL